MALRDVSLELPRGSDIVYMVPSPIRKNGVLATQALVFLLLWVIWGLNYANNDYSSYAMAWAFTQSSIAQHGFWGGLIVSITNLRFEAGYTTLNALMIVAGIRDYSMFVALIAAVTLLSFWILARKYTRHPTLAMMLYAIYPFLFDVIQLRYAIAQIVVLFSLRFLRAFTWRNIVAFATLIIIASSIHQSALVFVCLVFAYIQNYRRIMALSTVSLVFFLVVFRIMPGISAVILGAAGKSDNKIRLLQDIGAYGDLVSVAGYSVISALVLIAVASCMRQLARFGTNQYSAILARVCCMMPLFAGLLVFNSEFYRLFRTMIIIFIFFSFSFRIPHEKLSLVEESRASLSWTMTLMLSMASVLWFFISHLHRASENNLDGSNLFDSIMTHNWLFDYFKIAF